MAPNVDQARSITQVLRALGQSADRDARARRGSIRRPVNVRVLLHGDETIVAWALNLSAGGIRVACEETLRVGDLVSLRIEGGEDGADLAGHGRVVWVKQCSDGLVSGIEFVEPM